MICRPHCAACCIFPSISSPIPGMSEGKPAMVACIQLDSELNCKLFGKPERPKVCRGFQPEVILCGQDAAEARKNFMWLLDKVEEK
ncbi:MAG TPA: hypothetical protein DCL86_08780 [Bacteroidales bacterium]|nr:hypothetical protein [Bacteroidales bacterium]